MKSLQKIIVGLLIVVFLLSIFPYRTQTADASTSAADNYLVVLRDWDNNYTGYTNLIEKSPKGNLMIKAKMLPIICDDFNFYANYDDDTFTLMFWEMGLNEKYYNVYTLNKNKLTYNYESDGKLVKNVQYTSTYKAYKSKKSGFNLIHVTSINNFPNKGYHYFPATGEYKKKGYRGVIFYDDFEKRLPAYGKLAKVVDLTKAIKHENNTISHDSSIIPEGVPTTKYKGVTIYGVSEFIGPCDINEYRWGNYADDLDLLKEAIDAEGDILHTIYIEAGRIQYTHIGAGAPAIELIQDSQNNQYKLNIYVRLDGSDLAKGNAEIVRMLCYKISSKPEKLFKAIYDSWETDNTHKINTDSYVTIGDAKVKYQKGGTYLIKSAK